MSEAFALRAADLKRRFGVYGHFYQLVLGGKAYACRSVLELVAHDATPLDIQEIQPMQPGLVVVMMNPGSSRPLEGEYLSRRVASSGALSDADPTRQHPVPDHASHGGQEY